MMLTHKDKLSEYVDFLYESAEEVRILSKEVLIGVTNFFRDPDFFQCLKEKAVPDIINRSAPDDPIRVWVAGCSTGEEAYSIAILFSEVMESLKVKRVVKIFATDLDAEAINTAAKGVYVDNIVDAVSPVRLVRYFTRRTNTYTINCEIRKMIVFSPHNVFQNPPFGRLDLIFCRNMLIYFQPVLQNDLFAIFHQALKDGAYLFLGKDVQSKLDRSVAEQECVNEELQAANEELQSSNEELQSVNEELYTVNSEYQQKLAASPCGRPTSGRIKHCFPICFCRMASGAPAGNVPPCGKMFPHRPARQRASPTTAPRQ